MCIRDSSWGDQHVNATLLSGLETAPTSAIFALMYGDINDTDGVVEYALKHRNLTVVGRNAAVVRGTFAGWALPPSTGAAPNDFLSTCAVSYTHLDVYKRQVLPTQRRRRAIP